MSAAFENDQNWKKQADSINSQFYQQKEALEEIEMKRRKVAATFDKKLLSELRALDRIPQIDLINEIFE